MGRGPLNLWRKTPFGAEPTLGAHGAFPLRNLLVLADEPNGSFPPDPDLYGRSVERQHRVMSVNSAKGE
jgi:hypothetical protein